MVRVGSLAQKDVSLTCGTLEEQGAAHKMALICVETRLDYLEMAINRFSNIQQYVPRVTF